MSSRSRQAQRLARNLTLLAIAALIRLSGGNEYAMLPMLVSPWSLQDDLAAVQREAQVL